MRFGRLALGAACAMLLVVLGATPAHADFVNGGYKGCGSLWLVTVESKAAGDPWVIHAVYVGGTWFQRTWNSNVLQWRWYDTPYHYVNEWSVYAGAITSGTAQAICNH